MNRMDFFKTFKNQKYVDQLQSIPQKFNVTHDEEKGVSEITIYGVIGDTWFSDSFSANDIDQALNAAGDNDVIINLNSPGGDAFDGIAIFNRLKRHNGKVTVHVDGWACSAASVIAMAADELVMELGSMFMIHEASNIVWGSKQDMRKEADVLEQLEDGIIDIYMTKANIGRDEVREKMDAETWMSAKTAAELGFADSVAGAEQKPEPEPQNRIQDRQNALDVLNSILNKNNQQPVPREPELEPAPKQNLAGLFLNLKGGK